MSFKYFKYPREFAYLAEEGQTCHFCQTTDDCLDGATFHGTDEIEAICFSCVEAGKLIDLDISANDIELDSLNPANDPDAVSKEIIYCTPGVPTWQDFIWPVKNGIPYTFIKIASKLDYQSKEHFTQTLFDCDPNPDLWEMLPAHKIENMKLGQYDITFYLFQHEGNLLTIWDAN